MKFRDLFVKLVVSKKIGKSLCGKNTSPGPNLRRPNSAGELGLLTSGREEKMGLRGWQIWLERPGPQRWRRGSPSARWVLVLAGQHEAAVAFVLCATQSYGRRRTEGGRSGRCSQPDRGGRRAESVGKTERERSQVRER